MPPFEIAFWACVALVAYPYLIYPLILAVLVRLRARPVRRAPLQADSAPSVSFLVAAYNEQDTIGRRLDALCLALDQSGLTGEILVLCDGCSDDTARRAREHAGRCVRVLELAENHGKAAALTRGAAEARHDILVLADVRQTWADDALERLLENFADPQVGAVSGDLEVRTGNDSLAGVGLYWQYEKWLRRQESAVWAQVGVTGAISACRRVLFAPIPPGTLLDDVYWPLGVAMRGFRVIHDSRARAYDRLPNRPRDEFRRKVRTLAGNYQLIGRLPAALLPWRNPVWLEWLSHKLARLLVPWALLGLLGCSVALAPQGGFWAGALAAQVSGYALGLAGLKTRRLDRAGSAAASFLVLNAAAWVAFWVWISGRAARSWHKARYDNPRRPAPVEGRQPAASS